MNKKCLDVCHFHGPVVETIYDCNDDSTADTIKNGDKCLSRSSDVDALEIWVGELSDNSYAVMLLNREMPNLKWLLVEAK